MFNFEWTFRAGDLLTLISALAIAAAFLYRKGGDETTIKLTLKSLTDQLAEMKLEITKLGDILIGQARFDEKLQGIDRRVTGHDREIADLRRGAGWITQERKSVDGEYP